MGNNAHVYVVQWEDAAGTDEEARGASVFDDGETALAAAGSGPRPARSSVVSVWEADADALPELPAGAAPAEVYAELALSDRYAQSRTFVHGTGNPDLFDELGRAYRPRMVAAVESVARAAADQGAVAVNDGGAYDLGDEDYVHAAQWEDGDGFAGTATRREVRLRMMSEAANVPEEERTTEYDRVAFVAEVWQYDVGREHEYAGPVVVAASGWAPLHDLEGIDAEFRETERQLGSFVPTAGTGPSL